MTEKVILGGFVSSQPQFDQIAHDVQQATDTPTSGLGYAESRQDLAATAARIDRQDVYTHSGGLLVVRDAIRRFDARLASLTAIAPSVQSQVRTLVARGLLIGMRDPAQQEQFTHKVRSSSATRELREHPLIHVRAIHDLAHFASMKFLADLAESGVPTTVALMSHDGLFDNDKIPPVELERIASRGGAVLRVSGVHNSFTRSPVDVLGRIDTAPSWFTVEEGSGDYLLPAQFCVSWLRQAMASRPQSAMV